jgi:hypothetical protein
MAELVATQIDGTPLLLEVRAGDDPERDVSILRDTSFDGVVEAIKKISTQLSAALNEVKPDKAALEFGVDVGIESGQLTALIVKGSGSASLKITLEWGKAG